MTERETFRIFLFGSLPDKGRDAGDIDLIAVAMGGSGDLDLEEYEDLAYDAGKQLDVFLLAPNWGQYAMNHHDWMGDVSDLTAVDIATAVREYFGEEGTVWKFVYDPEIMEWTLSAGWADNHFDFTRETSPDDVRALLTVL